MEKKQIIGAPYLLPNIPPAERLEDVNELRFILTEIVRALMRLHIATDVQLRETPAPPTLEGCVFWDFDYACHEGKRIQKTRANWYRSVYIGAAGSTTEAPITTDTFPLFLPREEVITDTFVVPGNYYINLYIPPFLYTFVPSPNPYRKFYSTSIILEGRAISHKDPGLFPYPLIYQTQGKWQNPIVEYTPQMQVSYSTPVPSGRQFVLPKITIRHQTLAQWGIMNNDRDRFLGVRRTRDYDEVLTQRLIAGETNLDISGLLRENEHCAITLRGLKGFVQSIFSRGNHPHGDLLSSASIVTSATKWLLSKWFYYGGLDTILRWQVFSDIDETWAPWGAATMSVTLTITLKKIEWNVWSAVEAIYRNSQ